MAYIKINAEGCKACSLCIEFCPRKCLALADDINSRGFHPAAVVDPEKCSGCGICATMCPDVCIEVYRERKPVAAAKTGGTS